MVTKKQNKTRELTEGERTFKFLIDVQKEKSFQLKTEAKYLEGFKNSSYYKYIIFKCDNLNYYFGLDKENYLQFKELEKRHWKC